VKSGQNRREFLRSAGIGVASLALSASQKVFGQIAKADSADKPNFIVILTDDLGYGDIECFGAKERKTPNLDRMALEGMKFTDFYSAAPVCSPSRAALMTGCYAQRVSIPRVLNPSDKIGLNPDEITIAEILKKQGYATACIGKWHLGHRKEFLPLAQGFDYYFGLPYSNDMRPQNNKKHPPLPLIEGSETIEQNPDQSLLTSRYTEKTISFIRNNKNRPFFVYLAHSMPHVPLYVSDKLRNKTGFGLYADVIAEIDWSVGQILQCLKELSIDDKTLVIFTSDNGPWLAKGKDSGSAGPLRDGKFSTFEGGMRVPCIMRWPEKISAGKTCSRISTMMDFLPTMTALAGSSVPADRIIDGKDIYPLMINPAAQTPHQAFYYYNRYRLEAVRAGNWKLIFERKDSDGKNVPIQLYDLENDIGEKKDVSAQNQDAVKRLQQLADIMRKDLGDSITNITGKNVRPAGSSQ